MIPEELSIKTIEKVYQQIKPYINTTPLIKADNYIDNTLLLEEMLNNLFYIAASDGHISVNEIDLLKSISQSFSFDEKTFQRIFQTHLKDSSSDPYKILGVDRDDSDQEIRKKWIELNKEHHPDNLIAKGMPEEFIEQSNKELAAINLAYDKIKEIRSSS